MSSFNQAYATKVGHIALFVLFCILIAIAGVVIFILFLNWMFGDFMMFGESNPPVTDGITAVGLVLAALAVYQGALQLKNAQKSQYIAFVSDYVSKLFANEEFVNTFYYLIYTYSPEVFEEVESKLEYLLNEERNTNRDLQEEMYQRLECLQSGRKAGDRFYHPRLFQGSVEEKRLDSLLGYFNFIAYAYYNEKELIAQEDINGIIGYHLDVMVGSTVVREYFDYIDEVWEKQDTVTRFVTHRPFHHLIELCREWEQKRKWNDITGVEPPYPS